MKVKFRKIIKYCIIVIFISMLFEYKLYAINTTDKMGRPILEITNPTAEYNHLEDTLSDANRKTLKASIDGNYKDPSQNIYSENTVESSDILAYDNHIKSLYDARMMKELEEYGEVADIRYTVSITDVNKDRCLLINDSIKDRLKMKIIVDNVGEHFAKDGFYKVNGKTYYFDADGYMVLGPARDKKGNYYFFSYETGELIE